MFEGKVVMIFGGSGTIGSGIVEQLLTTDVRQIRVFTNDENSLWECKERFGVDRIRYLLGDIRNLERVKRSLSGVDYVVNCAAIKHVPIGEYNPIELVNVNVIGLNNIIDACFYNGVERMIQVSTDKAVESQNLMGMSKAMGERLCWIRNQSRGINKTIISCVRFGNVYGSRGSLVPIIINCVQKNKPIPITDYEMCRFLITVKKSAKFILECLEIMDGGEIFIPDMEEFTIMQIVSKVLHEEFAITTDHVKYEEIGIREGEKLREKLYTDEEYKKSTKIKGGIVIK